MLLRFLVVYHLEPLGTSTYKMLLHARYSQKSHSPSDSSITMQQVPSHQTPITDLMYLQHLRLQTRQKQPQTPVESNQPELINQTYYGRVLLSFSLKKQPKTQQSADLSPLKKVKR